MAQSSRPHPLLRAAVYGWDTGAKAYAASEELSPGKGFWLASTAGCDATLAPPGA